MHDTSCRDWEDRIVAGRSLIPLAPLYPTSASEALEVFKALRMVDVVGQPTFGEACDQWVFDFVAAIFGAQDPESGERLIREFFLLISKKNGKSTIAAGIMITALLLNYRDSAELLIIAPTIEVAQNSFKPAADMVRADEELSDRLHVQDHLRTITDRMNGAALKVVAADNDTVSGKKAAFVLIDELWIFGKRKNAEAMLQEATGGLVARPEGFIIYLTTQSDEPPAGVFKSRLDYFRKVRDGEIQDPRSLGVIYEFPKRMVEAQAYLQRECFRVTNPNLERSVRTAWLEEELAKKVAEGGAALATFLSKHLNVEIGMNLRSNRWPGADFWAERVKSLTLADLMERCEVAAIGIDGGGLDDLFGLTVVGRERGTQNWLSWSHAWCHKGVLERRKQIAPRLKDFEAAGELTIVGDELDDVSAIVEVVKSVLDGGLLAAVAVDPAGLGELADALAEIGVTVDAKLLIGAPQGWGMMNSLKTVERKLANGTFFHAPSALMDWCVSNLKIEPTATGIRPTKQSAGDAKIDPAMALFDAVVVMMTNPQPKGGSMNSFFDSLRGAA
ncbi:terminase large subunit [Aureimonas ureilytica]|uniref:terminase large subunit n=1 Tax=Aureimonas ureilytica TaxID=401562 RepID=UPI003CF2779D